jgi:hypothetical protein
MRSRSRTRRPPVQSETGTFIVGDPSRAGQSGDIQGLSNIAEVDSESVEELAEEGQSFEAAAIDGIENAPDADAHEVTTRQVPADDVPEEYLDQD